MAVITDSEGVSERVVAGVAFCIPVGSTGTRETIGSVKKFYSIYEE